MAYFDERSLQGYEARRIHADGRMRYASKVYQDNVHLSQCIDFMFLLRKVEMNLFEMLAQYVGISKISSNGPYIYRFCASYTGD